VAETANTTITEDDGQFLFRGLPAGTYSVTFLLGQDVFTVSGVQVAPGVTTTLQETVDWDVGLTDTLIVRGASRQIERIATGWRLKMVAAPLIVCTHAQTREAILCAKEVGVYDLGRCEETGATIAAGLALGIF
jgi:hypothetical protein